MGLYAVTENKYGRTVSEVLYLAWFYIKEPRE